MKLEINAAERYPTGVVIILLVVLWTLSFSKTTFASNKPSYQNLDFSRVFTDKYPDNLVLASVDSENTNNVSKDRDTITENSSGTNSDKTKSKKRRVIWISLGYLANFDDVNEVESVRELNDGSVVIDNVSDKNVVLLWPEITLGKL